MTTTTRPQWADKLDASEQRSSDRRGSSAPTSRPRGEGGGWKPLSFLAGGPSYMADLALMEDVADGYDSRAVRSWHRSERSGDRVLAAGPGRRVASGIIWFLPELAVAVFFFLSGLLVWWPLLMAAGAAVLEIPVQVVWRRRSTAAIRREQAKLASWFDVDVEHVGEDGEGDPVGAAPVGGAAS